MCFGKKAPNARSPATCSRLNKKAPSLAGVVHCPCLPQKPNLSPAQAGRLSGNLLPQVLLPNTPTSRSAWYAPKYCAPDAVATSAMYSTMAQSRPAYATASIPSRWILCRSKAKSNTYYTQKSPHLVRFFDSPIKRLGRNGHVPHFPEWFGNCLPV